MTHTLHRRGTVKELEHDYVVLAMSSKDVNREGSAPKIAEILEIFSKYHPVICGNVAGNSMRMDIPHMAEQTKDNTVAHAVFRSTDDVIELLRELREKDLGVSIVVSGLFDRVGSCCRRAGLTPHTVNVSLGIWGNKKRLPSEDVLQIETMCGHNMVSVSLIEDQIDKIRKGRLTPEAAARRLARNCHCGIFNWERAADILRRSTEKESVQNS